MSQSGEMFLRMREADYNEMTEQQRSVFTYAEKFEVNEYELHKDDAYYIALYREKKKATDKLKAYLFDKRHKSNNYKGYRIEPNNTGWVNYDFFKPDDELMSGNGKTIEDCKEQIDELVNN